ncbi:hypothetical protein MJO28_004918 [Puccinia striiformis f. sp. tritici]|uniref:Uncharacterized protein n=1 Tax=Puccinia striiformis f. sp. tritici TaxID=168172 RepID=A0ACC0EJ91_9BASI|nr:hypothetical protein MJO28_004918 [Puccinia striiformis f. sp. tritici]
MLEISKEQWEDLIQQGNNKETTLKPSRVWNTPFPYYGIFKDISIIVNNQSNKFDITPAQSPPVILSLEQKTNVFKQILKSLQKGPKTVTCISGDVWLDVELKLSNPTTDVFTKALILGKGRTLDSGESLRPVVFKNVHFSYPARPDTPILNGLDLGITPGSSLAIAGSSGSGKSTLAYLFYDSTIHNQEGPITGTNELMSSQ